MKSSFSIGVALLLGLMSIDGVVLGLRGQRQLDDDPTDDQTVHCHIIPVDIQTGAGVPGNFNQRDYRCVTSIIDEGDNSPDMTYHIEIPPELGLSEEELNTGNIELTFTHVNKTRTPGTDEDGIQLTADSHIEVSGTKDERRRALAKTKGNVRLLVVRVNGPDMSPSLSASEMSDKFFGTNGDSSTLASVYKQCSHGQLIFEPASGTGITNGVGEIVIDATTQGTSPWALENIVTAATRTKFGSLSSYDHVAFCFPPGTSYPGAGTGWAAYAFIGEYRSFFNDRWCSYVSAQVHEIGHNMKLDHSNEDGAYGDASSMMGYSYPYDDSPTMCFNGAKHWFLGWYDDRKQEINPRDGPWVGNVVAFVDYRSATGADKILLKVADYYIQYNRAKGINSGTQEKRDEITVTEASNLVGTSESITGLSSSSKYFIFESYGEPARVEFCNAFTEGGADKVKVSVYLDSQGSACDGLKTPSPSMHPTPAPVPVPITAAPVPPTMVPTDPPTARPTVVPTLPPSPVPTADPTMRPTTDSPTLQPTEQPTLPPVFGPTPPPTPIPTLVPTTSSPTLRPTSPPSLPPSPVPIPLIPLSPLATPYPVVVPVIPQPILIVPVPRQAPPPVIIQAPFPIAAPNPNPVSQISFQIPAPIASPTLVLAVLPTGPPTQAPVTGAPVEPPSTDPCDDKDTVRFPTDAANGEQTCVWLRSPTRQNFRDILCVASHPAYEICEETCGRCSDTCEDDKTATFKMGEVDRPCSWLSDRTSIQNQVCKEGSVAWVACKETCNNCVVPDPTDIDDCASGEMFFQLFLKTDLDPDETSWTLTSFDGSYAIVGQNYTLPEHSITLFKCLPRNHYQFVIYDKGNNGLMDGHGSYSILLDGTEVQSGGSFQHAEDTFIQPFCGVESATLYIDLTTDVYGNETSWTLRTIGVNAPLLAVSGGPYAFLERYLIADCVPLNACYEFAIKDAQGDGLCCDYGEGSYMLKFNDKIVMSSRFSSGFEEVTTFGLSCIDTPKTVVSHYGSPVVDPSAKKKAYDSFEFGTMNVAANIPVVDNLISDDEDTAA